MKKFMTTMLLGSFAWQAAATDLSSYQKYVKTVNDVSKMSSSLANQKLADKYGLDILNVTWEDTGRSQGSSIGPNISDMTIQVHTIGKDGEIAPVAMPVIRYPNFSDKTADLKLKDFQLLVGNEKGDKLQKITLDQYLGDFRSFLTDDASWKGEKKSLLAARDTHVLVSSQITFLPVPKKGKATFNPVLFNYQSSEDNPAVLTIVATRQGTSATIIDNKRDAFKSGNYWSRSGQRLFFNKNGEKASFTGERQAEFLERALVDTNQVPVANEEAGLNMVLLIQVPLKHKARSRGPWLEMAMPTMMMRGATSNPIDNAVIGHGPVEGPFVEIDDLEIERDERFPIRVTVQFYKAIDRTEITDSEMKSFRKQIDQVYKRADYVGSLVTEGYTGRPTEHNGPECKLLPWWPIVRPLFLEKGLTEDQGIELLRRRYGYWGWRWFCSDATLLEGVVKETLAAQK